MGAYRANDPSGQVRAIALSAESVVMRSLVAGTEDFPVLDGCGTPHIADGEARSDDVSRHGGNLVGLFEQ